MPDDLIGWIIEVRNDEIPPSEKFRLENEPMRYAWKTDWHVVDQESFELENVEGLIKKPFEQWEAMLPVSLDECSVKVIKLAQDFAALYLHRNGHNVVEWRVRNLFTQEIVPGAVYGI